MPQMWIHNAAFSKYPMLRNYMPKVQRKNEQKIIMIIPELIPCPCCPPICPIILPITRKLLYMSASFMIGIPIAVISEIWWFVSIFWAYSMFGLLFPLTWPCPSLVTPIWLLVTIPYISLMLSAFILWILLGRII